MRRDTSCPDALAAAELDDMRGPGTKHKHYRNERPMRRTRSYGTQERAFGLAETAEPHGVSAVPEGQEQARSGAGTIQRPGALRVSTRPRNLP